MFPILVAALCLATFVSAARPKDAYAKEAARLSPAAAPPAGMSKSEFGVAGGPLEAAAVAEWSNVSASPAAAAAAALQVKAGAPEDDEGTRKLNADIDQCRKLAAYLKAQDYLVKATWTNLKNRIQPLSGESGNNKWKKIGRKLGLLETAAEEIAAKLTTIAASTAKDLDRTIITETIAIMRDYISLGDEDELGAFTQPLIKIKGYAIAAVDKGFSKKKYARHFKAFWVDKGRGIPDIATFDQAITPRTLIAEVMTPIKELLLDLAVNPADFYDAPDQSVPLTYKFKSFAERCLPDDHEFKEDELDAWEVRDVTGTGPGLYKPTGMYELSSPHTDCGLYMDGIEDSLGELLPFPILPSQDPDWTASPGMR